MSFSKAWDKTQPVKANQLKPKQETKQENYLSEAKKEDSLFPRFGEKKEDKK